MEKGSWKARLVPSLMVAGVASLILSLLLGGFIVYQWVLAIEAALASLAVFAAYLHYFHSDTRISKWPPLLPLAAIGVFGAAKSFYVAMELVTPMFVVVPFLVAVVWFVVSSLRILGDQRRITG